MEVILLERIEKLGFVGDLVNVKNGYARNFLIPEGKVLRATNENKEEFKSKRAEIEKENEANKKLAEKEAVKLADKFVVLTRQAGEDGRLYGSVSARDIAVEASKFDVEIKRSQIALNQPIKYLGVYSEKVTLHPEVAVNINVNVARTSSEAKAAEKEFLNPAKKEAEPEEFVEVASKEETPEAKDEEQVDNNATEENTAD